MPPVVIDSGPLVALLDADDQYHTWAVEQLHTIETPILTCEAVISESCHLLGKSSRGHRAIEKLFSSSSLKIGMNFSNRLDRIFTLMRKYQDTPMSFADACLVCMAEEFTNSTVFTLDSDFRIYRKNKRQLIPLISP